MRQLWNVLLVIAHVAAWLSLAAFVVVLASGVTMVVRRPRGAQRRAEFHLHRRLTLGAEVLIGVHVGVQAVNSWIERYPANHRLLTYVLGYLAYACLLVPAVSTAWRAVVPRRLWRVFHRVSYLAIAFGIAHSVSALLDHQFTGYRTTLNALVLFTVAGALWKSTTTGFVRRRTSAQRTSERTR